MPFIFGYDSTGELLSINIFGTKKKEDFMKRFVLVALMKALVITVGTNLLYVLYGLIFENHFEINLKIEIIFFLVVFFISLIEYVWKNRNLWRE